MATRKRKTCKRGRRKGTRSCRRKPGPKKGKRKTCKRGHRKGTRSCRRKPGPKKGKKGKRSKRRKRKSKFRMHSKKKIQCNNNYLVGDIESCVQNITIILQYRIYDYLDRKLKLNET